MPDLNPVLKKIIILKKSNVKYISLIYFIFQNKKTLTCMGIA